MVAELPIEGTLSLGGLLDFADKMGCELQDKHGQCPFLYLFQFVTKVYVFEGNWANDHDKYATIDAFRRTLSEFPEVTAYASITEAWMAAYATGERRATARVENDPRRQSALLIAARHRDGTQIERTYKVTYNKQGKPSRSLVNYGPNMKSGGYMTDLFAPPKPLPPGFPKVADA